MAKQSAPVPLTGGAGFNFEDQVAARYLVDMLSGTAPFGVEFGCVAKVDWQVRDRGRLLDDLAITMRSAAGEHVAEFSIKSDRQVTSGGFPSHFVEAAWEEWHHVLTTAFRRESDLMVLVAGHLANEVHESWSSLLVQARSTTPDRLVNRLQPPRPNEGSQSSEISRTLFESFHCPLTLCSNGQSDHSDTVEVIRRVRLLYLDFVTDPSRDKARAIADCRDLLESSNLEEGRRLWEALVSLAAENRGSGGTLDLESLLARLRPSFQLSTYPDYRGDWIALARATSDVLADIRTEIGGTTRIDRSLEVWELVDRLDTSGICLAAGESGCGKSALAKEVASQHYDLVVALLPEDLEFDRLQQVEERLRIGHPLMQILRTSRGRCLLFLDSLERLSERGCRLAGRLIVEILADTRCQHVHILLVSQYDSVQRVIARLGEAGIEQSKLDITPIDRPTRPKIHVALKNVPGVAWSTLHHDMRSLLRNLKILDWVVRASQSGRSIGEAHVTGLISLIDYLWSRWIESDDRGAAGGGLLKKIAVLEASTFAPGVPLTSLEYAEQQAVESLTSADLLKRKSERVSFSHDLLGDWSRLRVLMGEDPTWSSDGLKRCGTPRWHRAVRLFGRWLLSQTDGVHLWSEAITRAENGSDEGAVVRDLLLESVVVSENARSLFSAAWPTLIKDDGRLLKLLLDRFMFIATIPDLRLPKLVGGGAISPQVEVAFRVPLWPYWGSVLATLMEHRDEVCRLVPGEAARICKMWLETSKAVLAASASFGRRGRWDNSGLPGPHI